jgi:hypothetical protein
MGPFTKKHLELVAPADELVADRSGHDAAIAVREHHASELGVEGIASELDDGVERGFHVAGG